MVRALIKQVCPPIIWNTLSGMKKKTIAIAKTKEKKKSYVGQPEKQDLDLYWDPEFAKVLEEWGRDNTWNEIQMILASRKGKVLDIACGTGITMKILEKYPEIELYGFDISDLLIRKAIEKGIRKERLKVADATKTDYLNSEFDYSYSIGSLEHFTLEGIDSFIAESSRYTKYASFHMIPISRIGQDEGWMKTVQSFFNNSEDWWYSKFRRHYRQVYSIPSKWDDEISFGRWFICIK